MQNRTILISGAGVVGPTLAYWLLQNGFEPTIVERAPQFRTGGYMLDFWGVGYDVAEKMGIMPMLQERGYKVNEVRIVDTNNKKISGFKASVFDEATNGRFISISRGDLAEAIYQTVAGDVQTIFNDSITALKETENGVLVTFEHAPAKTFDLVIGSDGLHSTVREQTFGVQAQYEKHLGYMCAAFEATGYPQHDTDVYVTYNQPGKQAVRFSMHDDKTLFFFVFESRAGELPDPHDTQAHKELMHEMFDDAGWECLEIMQYMDDCDEVYFDRVSQIQIPSWSKGRIALVGDAAFCPSLLAGEGSSLGMAGAYLLAQALADHNGDYEIAFKEYEESYRPLIERKQTAASQFAQSFAPRTRFGLWVRNQVMKLFVVPFLARIFVGNSLRDDFHIK